MGGSEYKRAGLTRALFCIRLLEQSGNGTAEERLSFLYGIYLEAEIEAFRKFRDSQEIDQISIVGPSALASIWQQRLQNLHLQVQTITEEQRERMYIEGLRQVLDVARQRMPLPSISQ